MPEYSELCYGALRLCSRNLIEEVVHSIHTSRDLSHGSTLHVSIGLGFEGNAMLDWKADLERVVENSTTFAKRVRVQSPMPRTIIEPGRMPLVNWAESEREEIGYRIANFKAHQQRFEREREDHAASELKRMRAGRY